MQKILFKTMLLLMVIPINNWIAHSQPTQPTINDSVSISRDAQRKCVKCFQNAPIKDSIIIEQSRRIEIKDSMINVQTVFIDSAEQTVHKMDEKLTEYKVKNIDLERKKKNGWKFGVPIGGVAGGIIGWILSGKLK